MVTGFLLTGVGERNIKGETNYLVVNESIYFRLSPNNSYSIYIYLYSRD